MKKFLSFIAFTLFALSVYAQFKSAPAFPGAEGHGRFATGGRNVMGNCTIVHVTNLNASGEGSFRSAVTGGANRIVVFDVAGVIPLSSDITFQNNITILGQTAPYPGITLRYRTVQPGSNNIIRFIRIRRGQEKDINDGADATWQRQKNNIIFDHCSFSWSIDEVASFYDNNNFTMQWCTVAESLCNPGHNKGTHGYGGIWGGKLASFHHNMIAHVYNRGPRFNGARYKWSGYTQNTEYETYNWKNTVEAENVDFRNCVMYNAQGTCYGGPGGGQINIVNNYFKAGGSDRDNQELVTKITVGSSSNSTPTEMAGMTSRYYISGNTVHTTAGKVTKNHDWDGVIYDSGVYGSGSDRYSVDPGNFYTAVEHKDFEGNSCVPIRMAEPCPVGYVTTHDAATAFEKVLTNVGASLYRDEIDQRYVTEATNGTTTYMGAVIQKEGLIDLVSDVNGYTEATFPMGKHPEGFDADNDGIADDWELANGLDPTDSSDALSFSLDSNGYYRNIEVYANSLVEKIMKDGNANAQSGFTEYYPSVVAANTENEKNIIASGECGENATWTLDEEGLLTISGTGAMTDSQYVDDVPWYNYHESIKKVQIEDGITTIRSHAFSYCKNLTSINIPVSVTTLGESCFYHCSLTRIEIPESVNFIANRCFDGLLSLTYIDVVPSNNVYMSIDGVLFTKDKKTIIRHPAGKTISSYTIPNGVTSIDEYCFDNCSNLTNVEIPNGVTSLGIRCFNNCSSLTSADLPASVTSLGAGCFGGCNSLTSMNIPEGVTSLSDFCFERCNSLTSIDIPANVTSIRDLCFGYCSNLTDVTNYSPQPQKISRSSFSIYGTLHVLKGCGEAYRKAEVWKNFTIVEDVVDPNVPIESDTDISEYDNILYLDKTEVCPGQQAVLSFKMKNTAAIQTIGVYLELPTGMTAAEDDGDLLIELSAARTKASRHAISSNYVDGQYRIGILGIAGREFEGTDGEVFTVTVDVDEEMAEGDYPVILRNINLTDTSDVPHDTSHYKTTISVVDITPGDANGDGSVNMSDANMVTNYFLGKTNAAMKAKASDVNNDGSINMTDANMIVNMYLNQ